MSGILEAFTLEKAILLATPPAKKIFANHIQPLLKNKIGNYFKTKNALNIFEKQTIEYLARLGGQCSVMSTIAFQNTPKRLDDLYIPLNIRSTDRSEQITICDDVEIFKSHKRLLITDAAGMGKSTLSKKIVLNTLNKSEIIPVFIELRKLKDIPISEQVKDHLGINKSVDKKILHELPLVYIFDGLDEVPNDLKKNSVKLLKDFSEEFKEANILITSRHETFLSEFYNFQHYSITPLDIEEAFDLIRKCDPEGSISEPLIKGIMENDESSIHDFLSTPLYVSLLFCSYRYKTVIPQKKNIFYSQVYDALFESHDLSKEATYVRQKNSSLDSTDFHSVLRRLGFWCLKNNGKIEFQKDELEIVINDILAQMKSIKKISASSFSKDLTTTVPLFVREGSIVRWSHKSLMEYFAAMFICNDTKGKQCELLLKLFHSESSASYTNIFELCADIDYTSFRSSILKEILVDFLEYRQNKYTEINNKKISRTSINTRASLNFSTASSFIILEEFNHENFEWYDNTNQQNFIKNSTRSDKSKYGKPEASVHHRDQGYTYYISSYNDALRLLRIIENRKPELFIKTKYNTQKLNSAIAKSSLKPNKFYTINDNPKNPINSSTNFDTTTQILLAENRIAIDVDAAEAELQLIELDQSNGINSLLEGI
jgi:predicted NACHT family NTPase